MKEARQVDRRPARGQHAADHAYMRQAYGHLIFYMTHMIIKKATSLSLHTFMTIILNYSEVRGGEFLKKLRCCVRGKV